MLHRLSALLVLANFCVTINLAGSTPPSLQERVAHAPGQALGTDGSPLPGSIVLQRTWTGAQLNATLRNTGKTPARVASVVLAEWEHGLPATTPVYGEGFTMLSQTGGTLGSPIDEGYYADRSHYKIPEAAGRRTVYGLLRLQPNESTTWLLGFASAHRFVGRFSFDARVLSISIDTEGLELAPGDSWKLEPLLCLEGGEPQRLFGKLKDSLQRNHPRIARGTPATGWCSWYCFGPSVTANQIRGNLAWAREHAPGLRYIQIDDGYQPWMGDWLEVGKSFGGDLPTVLHEIKQQGFEPAIWVAPFVASPQSRLFREHPEWFVTDDKAQPLRSDRIGFGGWRLGPWYVLDGTHPGAQRWLEETFRTMRRDWGCTYFKLDATYWGAMHGGVHHDRAATRVEAYRRGMEAIRRGAGDAFILGCNHPMWPSLGLIHGSRSSMDVSRDWPSFSKTGRENLLRGWQNGALWWNDPDATCLNGLVQNDGPDGKATVTSIGKATEDEFLFHATLVYATGGMLLMGDDMRTYKERELKRVRELLPPTGAAMNFDRGFQVGRIAQRNGERVALLNWHDEPATVTVPLKSPTHIREIWSGADLGLHSGTFTWTNFPAHAGRLLELK